MTAKIDQQEGISQSSLLPRGKNIRTLICFFLFSFALLMPFHDAGGAISHVQSPGSFSQYFGFGPSSVDIPITANVTAGNSVIVTFLWGGWSSAETTSCTDSQGNSYSVDVNEYYSGAGLYTIVCSAHNVSALGTSDTITLTFSSGTYGVSATVHEFSGLAAVATLDQVASNNGSSATPSSGNTATTTQAEELLVGAIGVSGPPTDSFTPGSGYTALSSVGFTGVWNGTIRPEYRIVSATGSYQADGTLGTSRGWAAGIATYKAAAATTNVTVSGTLYSDEGTTPLPGQTVRLLIDGVSEGTDVTDASGNYSITTTVAAGDSYVPLLVYVDDGSVKATTVTVMDPVNVSNTISNLDLYADHLVVRNDYGFAPLDNGDMNGARGGATDPDILYTVSWPDVAVTGTNTELYVASGHSYRPQGNVTTAHMKINGTVTADSNTFTVSGNWEHTNGNFIYGTSTVDFTGTGTITVGGTWWTKPFYNVNAAAAGQTTTIAVGIGVTNVLTLGSGTLAGGNVNLSLDTGTPLITSGTTFTNSQIKFHPNNGGPINVAGAAYNNVWLAGNAATNSFNLLGDMSCTTLSVYGSGPGGNAIFDTANYAISCNDLIIGSSTNLDRYGTLRLNNSVVDVSANVTINSSDTGGTNQIDAGSATINVGGDWTNDDTFTYGTSTVNFTGSGTVSMGSGSWWDRPFYNVTAAASGQTTTILAGQGIAIENDLVLGSGTLTGGDVILNKSSGTPLTTSATLDNTFFMYSTETSGIVYIAPADYPDLRIAGWTSGVTNNFRLAGDISCGALEVAGTDPGSVTVLDTSTNNYSIDCNSLEVGAAWDSSIYNRLVLNGSTVTISGPVTIDVSDGGGTNEIDAGGSTINVSGDWTNNDTFTPGTSTVVLNGANQTLSGSTTFHNLTKAVSSADTLTFTAGTTQTITGTATLNGASGQLLRLRSSAPGTRWNLNLAAGATKAISYVDVQDSDASGSDAALLDVNPTYSVDSGNNVRWFGSANITVTKSSLVLSDPINGTLDPKRIPGAVVEYTIIVANTAGAQATDVTLTDDLSGETATVGFVADAYAAGKGIQLTAPNVNGGAPLALTNAADADPGDYGVTSPNTVTVGGIVLSAGEQATIKFRVVIQ